MNKRILLVLLPLIVAISARGQEILTIDKAIELAVSNNHDVLISRNQEAIAQIRSHPGAAGLLPGIQLSGNTGYTIGNSELTFVDPIPSQNIKGAESQFNSASIGVSYTLFDGLFSVYSLKKLKSEAGQASALTRASIENTILQVVSTYLEAARLEESLEISRQNMDLSKGLVKRARAAFDFGQSKLLLLNAQVDFNNDSIIHLNNENNLIKAKRDLNVLIGREAETDYDLDTEVSLQEDYSLDELLESARSNNAQLLLAEFGIENAAFDVKLARAGKFPLLAGQAGYGVDNFKGDAGQLRSNLTYEFSGGLNLAFNIFDGNVSRKNMKSAELALENAGLLREQTLLNVEKDLMNAFSDYLNSLTILRLQTENLETAEQNYERSRLAFENGSITNLELREAQVNLRIAQNLIVNAKVTAKLYEYVLLQLSGKLLE